MNHNSKAEKIIDILFLGFLLTFLSVYFDIRLLFLDTVVTGGDTASWYGVTHHMLNVLLPQGRLTGWDMGNFCGYPNFSFYFIPPFLIAVLPSYFFGIPLTITLKIAIISGIFILPVSTYFGLRAMTYRFPAPIIGAAASLLFLLNEFYVMFGGNALSTFAGEFCYMFAFALLPWFMGSLYHGVKTGKGAIKNGIILGLIGLSHLFVFIPAVFLVIYWYFAKGQVRYLWKVSWVGFGLMAFWILPLLAYRHPYTIPVYMIWQGFVNWPYTIAGLGLIFLVLGPGIALQILKRQKIAHPLLQKIPLSPETFGMFASLIFGCVVAYFAAHFLKIPDIRFLPPILFVLILLFFADTLGRFLSSCKLSTRIFGAITICLFCVVAVIFGTSISGHWYRYNNSGYEAKPGYKEFKKANDYLRKTESENPLNAPRVGYEKCDLYNPYGGDRVFESLPFFSGRQTMEGIHYSSSIASKCMVFFQTEYSRDIKTPSTGILSRMNPEALPAHFDLYNMSQLILMTDKAKKAIATSSLFAKEAAFGPISIYRYRGCDGRYVDVPKIRPVVYTSKNWVEDFYEWYKQPEQTDVLLVPEDYIINEEDRSVFSHETDSVSDLACFQKDVLDRTGLKIKTHLEHLKIRFTTNKIGLPHLIKVSYFPAWQVKGANEVYPVSPHLMMVIPRESEVVLTYGRTFCEKLGWTITGITLMILILRCFFLKRLHVVNHAYVQKFFMPVEKSLTFLRPFLLVLVILIAFVLIVSGAIKRNQPVRAFVECRESYNTGIHLLNKKKPQAAKEQFENAINTMEVFLDQRKNFDHRDIINCILFTAMSYESLGKRDKAETWYQTIISEYSYCRYLGEAYVKIGRIKKFGRNERLNEGLKKIRGGEKQAGLSLLQEAIRQTRESREYFQTAIKKDPYSVWAEYALEDMKNEEIYLEKIKPEIFSIVDDKEFLEYISPAIERNKETKINIFLDAKSGWFDTRIPVNKGEKISIECWGTWAAAPETESQTWPDTGPEGHGTHPAEKLFSNLDSQKELPRTPFGALLGRVNDTIFAIGDKKEIVAPKSGRLFLVINDLPFHRYDNRGSLSITVHLNLN